MVYSGTSLNILDFFVFIQNKNNVLTDQVNEVAIEYRHDQTSRKPLSQKPIKHEQCGTYHLHAAEGIFDRWSRTLQIREERT